MAAAPDSTTEHLLRELAPQVLGIVARKIQDFDLAEDAVQDALMAAATQWPRDGLPESPRAWLLHVAYRSVTDNIRAESARRRREGTVALDPSLARDSLDADATPERDDALLLLFMCCHPALTPASAIALTLRAVGGLTTAEIARAFLVPEATMAQRISRAKQTIKESGIPFQSPAAEEWPHRLRDVLHVLYLIFNEGYATSVGSTVRRNDLSFEAIRLTRALHHVEPADPEIMGLLALMLLTDARRLARTGPVGELVPLRQQDRSLWDTEEIAEGIRLLSAALPKGMIGQYQLQAAIAAVHDEATRFEDTDWPQILALYDLLKQVSDNPVVVLNHAVATAMVHGPAKALELLRTLDSDSRLAHSHRLAAVRAHLLEMAGDREGAIAHYRTAADRTMSIAERNYLVTQAARLSESSDETQEN